MSYNYNSLMYAERAVAHLLELRKKISADLAVERRNVQRLKRLKKLHDEKEGNA